MTVRPAVCDTHEEQYHLLILDPTHTQVLAARPARSWLLPYLRFRSQMPEALVFRPYLTSLGVDATPIHEALLRGGCGLEGDPLPRGIAHRYIALEAHETHVQTDRLTWEPLDELLGKRGSPVLPIQETALRTCLERFQHAIAPFDSPAQLRAAHDWIVHHLATMSATITGDCTYYRIRRFDMIVAFPTTKGTVYFKGGPRRMAHEAELTQALQAILPRHFPATIAYDPERHWWLTPSVPGIDLTTEAAGEAVWHAAIKLLATAQRKTMRGRRVAAALGHRRFGAPQFAAIAARVRRMLAEGSRREHWPEARLDALDERLRDAIDRLLAYDLPCAWTPADFVGLNIFHDGPRADREDDDGRARERARFGGGRVWFIGIDNSYLAPPTLAISRLFHDLTFRVHTPQPMIERLTDTYVEAWQGEIPPDLLRRALADTEICGRLFTFRSRLDRHARHHGLWSSEGDGLPANTELHEEAHQLGLSVLPKLSLAGAGSR